MQIPQEGILEGPRQTTKSKVASTGLTVQYVDVDTVVSFMSVIIINANRSHQLLIWLYDIFTDQRL